jgi:hypothetical protein
LVRDIHCYLTLEWCLSLIGVGFGGILAEEFDIR